MRPPQYALGLKHLRVEVHERQDRQESCDRARPSNNCEGHDAKCLQQLREEDDRTSDPRISEGLPQEEHYDAQGKNCEQDDESKRCGRRGAFSAPLRKFVIPICAVTTARTAVTVTAWRVRTARAGVVVVAGDDGPVKEDNSYRPLLQGLIVRYSQSETHLVAESAVANVLCTGRLSDLQKR